MLDLLRKRRSVRKFKKTKVEKEKIDGLVKAALLSPSSRSIRPWEFIVITEEKLIADLSKSKEHGSSFLKDAPLAIIVLGDESKSDVWVEDTSIASVLIQVMAESMDLGSCWIQIRGRKHNPETTSEAYIKNILDIPEEIKIESIIAIGYPDEEKSSYSEEDLLYEKVFFNTYKKN